MEAKYRKLLILSIVIALGSVLGPAIPHLRGATGFVLIGFPLSIAWCLILAYAFQQFKQRRALWFLLGVPLALFWPLGFALLVLGVVRM
jgi:hypothetical protein